MTLLEEKGFNYQSEDRSFREVDMNTFFILIIVKYRRK